MVRCNLSVLLAERNLKITKVSKDTGISRTTLTYLVNNYSKGIQYDTLNTLCSYLHILPSDIILYIPVDIYILNVTYMGENDEEFNLELQITHKGMTKKCELYGNTYLYFYDFDDPMYNPLPDRMYESIGCPKIPCSVDINISLWDSSGDADIESKNQFVISAFNDIPITFLKDLEYDIAKYITDHISTKYNYERYTNITEPISAAFNWDNSLIKK